MKKGIPTFRPSTERRNHADLIVKRLLIPVIIIIGLLGLVHYTMTGVDVPEGAVPVLPDQRSVTL